MKDYYFNYDSFLFGRFYTSSIGESWWNDIPIKNLLDIQNQINYILNQIIDNAILRK